MTPERIVKLDQLGFAWDCRKNNTGTSKGVVFRADPDGIEIQGMNGVVQMPSAPAPVAPPTQTQISLTTSPSVTLPSGLLRSGGFPFPRFPAVSSGGNNSSRSISAFKVQLHRQQNTQEQSSKSMAAMGPVGSGNGAAPTAAATSNSKLALSVTGELDVSKLPREFLSFSTRKFTSFPKVNIPK